MKRWIDIDDRSAVAAIRRLARRYGGQIELPERRIDELAIVVTEAATNIVRHAGRGRALFVVLRRRGVEKLALLFTDSGPGIRDIDRMLQDGESTMGSAGLGLGAIRRLSDSFDVFSSPDDGTTIVCTFDKRDEPPSHVIDVEGLRVCHPAETVCGDDWLIRGSSSATDILLCDGLGHGPLAAEAAAGVIETARKAARAPGALMETLTRAHTGQRGAVAAAVHISHDGLKMDYAGLGNISTIHVSSSGVRRLAVRDGRIGGVPTRGYEDTIQLSPGDLVILHSDGLRTLRETAFPQGLLHRAPLLIAGFLIDRAFRGRDDACIVVARVKGNEGQ